MVETIPSMPVLLFTRKRLSELSILFRKALGTEPSASGKI
jgi:hypothetical protein